MKRTVWMLLSIPVLAGWVQAQPRAVTDLAHAWIPEFRVETNIIGGYVDNEEFQGELGNRFSVAEAGLGMRAYVDPFFRLDVVFSGEESREGSEFGIEQALATWIAAPAGMELRLGKFRTSFGEYNDDDPDEHPQVTAPEVILAYWGEDDGYVDTGVSMNIYVPNPFDISNILWLGVFNGENPIAFHDGTENDPAYFARYEFFWQAVELGGIELGLSYLSGVNRRDTEIGGTPFEVRGVTNLYNVHFEFDYAHPVRYLYRGFSLLAEYYQQVRKYDREDELDAAAAAAGLDDEREETTSGYYVLGHYRLNRNWGISARYDSAPLLLVEFEEEEEEGGEGDEDEAAGAYTIYGDEQITAYSLMLNYYPSRFSTVRLQYTNRRIGDDETVNEFWLQFQVLIGFERPDVF